MALRFIHAKKPFLPRSRRAGLLLSILAIPVAIIFVSFLAQLWPLAYIPFPLSILLTVWALAVFLWDAWLTRKEAQSADELYEFLKDTGEAVTSGLALESAVAQVCSRRRKSPVSRIFAKALVAARTSQLDDALMAEAAQLGDPNFDEAADLLTAIVQSEGDIGHTIKELGVRLADLRAQEREVQTTLNGAVSLLAVAGLFIIPGIGTMFGVVSEFGTTPAAGQFYAGIAMGVAFLQYTVHGSSRRLAAAQAGYQAWIYWLVKLIQYNGNVLTWDQLGLW